MQDYRKFRLKIARITTLFLCMQLPGVGSISEVYAHGGDLEEVVVTSSRTHRMLDDTPLRVQVLGEEELREKANMKPGDIRMMLNESTGIQVQQTSATSFNSSIRIQGLDGRYTQLLRDGLPIYSGFSGSLSLLQIAPLDLKQVELVKGASSTLYGGGAIAGLVNLISKTPEEHPETAVMLNGTSASGVDFSAFHARELGDHGLTLFGTYNRNDAYDPADNGLSAIPEFERVTFTPRWFYKLSNATKLDFGVGFIDESRLGGSMEYVKGNAPTDYFESNDSRRMYTRLGISHDYESGLELNFKNANSSFDRSLELPGSIFSGVQTSTFTELSVSAEADQSAWVAGMNALTEKFDHDQHFPEFDYDYSENTFGTFAQYTRDISDSVVLEGGLRLDNHSDYGSFFLPRFALLLLPNDDLTMRLGGGFGYKTPSLFISDAEEIQYQNLQPIDPDLYEAETSQGINFDINRRYDLSGEWSLSNNLLFFYTQISDALEIVEDNDTFRFEQDGQDINTQGAEFNLNLGYHEFRYLLGYTFVDAKKETPIGDQELNLVSKHRVNQVLVWEREDNFRIGLEAYYFSRQLRENDSPGKSYWIYGLMMEKRFSEAITGFLNFENFTDTRQTSFEDINLGDLESPEFRDIYAPLDGFVVNGGFRWRF